MASIGFDSLRLLPRSHACQRIGANMVLAKKPGGAELKLEPQKRDFSWFLLINLTRIIIKKNATRTVLNICQNSFSSTKVARGKAHLKGAPKLILDSKYKHPY